MENGKLRGQREILQGSCSELRNFNFLLKALWSIRAMTFNLHFKKRTLAALWKWAGRGHQMRGRKTSLEAAMIMQTSESPAVGWLREWEDGEDGTATNSKMLCDPETEGCRKILTWATGRMVVKITKIENM